jgi:hypothetical protein
MSLIRAVLRPAALTGAILLAFIAGPARGDTLADFRAALAEVSARYDDAATAVATGTQEEAKAAVHRLRGAWQDMNVRFTGNRPAPFVGDEDYGTMFMQVEVRLVGLLLVIDMGSRDAARAGLAPVEETLSQLKARSQPPAP